LNQETQRQILSRFHFALNERGYLILSNAETLLSHSDSFTPLDAKNRVFVKARRGLERGVPGRDHDAAPLAASAVAKGGPLRDEVFEASPVAQIVIDREGVLTGVNARARTFFGIAMSDVGRAFQDLELSYRPVELRSLIEQAHEEHRSVHVAGVPW